MCLPSSFPSSSCLFLLSDVSNMSIAICILCVLFFLARFKDFLLASGVQHVFPLLCYSVPLSVVPLLRLYWTCRVLALRNLYCSLFTAFSPVFLPEPCDPCTLHHLLLKPFSLHQLLSLLFLRPGHFYCCVQWAPDTYFRISKFVKSWVFVSDPLSTWFFFIFIAL